MPICSVDSSLRGVMYGGPLSKFIIESEFREERSAEIKGEE